MVETKLAERANPPKTGKKKPKSRRRMWLVIILLLLILLLVPLLIAHFIEDSQKSRIYSEVKDVPARPVAIIFGAGLNRDGSPSWMLADRIDAGVALYKLGKTNQLLMSGDGTSNNEVAAMRRYAMQKGVPGDVIKTDASGLRTYDTCWRAANNYQITQAILVTQGYHLPRALYLCNSLGVDAVGLKAGQDDYPNQGWYNSREFAALFVSWLDVNFIKPTPE